jgi:hypothetical protein
MKKILVIMLVLVFVFSFAACGGKDTGTGSAGGGADDSGKVDAAALAEDILEDAVAGNAFSEAAAEAVMQKLAGLGKADVEPEFAYLIDEETMGNYGDSSHATFFFIKDGGDVTTEEYAAWLKKVFDATAKVSDDGYNIQGYGFGEGEIEKSFDEVMDGGLMQVWSYKYNGQIMDVYPSTKYGSFSTGSKTYGTDDSGDIGVQIDIAVGMQKSWGEYEDDIEEAFEEHGDEIEDALKDYAN